jgi:hypothetical protein
MSELGVAELREMETEVQEPGVVGPRVMGLWVVEEVDSLLDMGE